LRQEAAKSGAISNNEDFYFARALALSIDDAVSKFDNNSIINKHYITILLIYYYLNLIQFIEK